MQNPTPMSSHPVIQPHQLDFTNPQSYSNMSIPQSSRTPQSRTPMTLTPTYSDTSPQTNKSSSFTPSLRSLKLGRGHGCSHKEVVSPTYDDFPHGGSDVDKDKWFKHKKTECGGSKS